MNRKSCFYYIALQRILERHATAPPYGCIFLYSEARAGRETARQH